MLPNAKNWGYFEKEAFSRSSSLFKGKKKQKGEVQVEKKTYQCLFKVSFVSIKGAPLHQSNKITGLGDSPSMKGQNNNLGQLKLEIYESNKINFLI